MSKYVHTHTDKQKDDFVDDAHKPRLVTCHIYFFFPFMEPVEKKCKKNPAWKEFVMDIINRFLIHDLANITVEYMGFVTAEQTRTIDIHVTPTHWGCSADGNLFVLSYDELSSSPFVFDSLGQQEEDSVSIRASILAVFKQHIYFVDYDGFLCKKNTTNREEAVLRSASRKKNLYISFFLADEQDVICIDHISVARVYDAQTLVFMRSFAIGCSSIQAAALYPPSLLCLISEYHEFIVMDRKGTTLRCDGSYPWRGSGAGLLVINEEVLICCPSLGMLELKNIDGELLRTWSIPLHKKLLASDGNSIFLGGGGDGRVEIFHV